MGRQVIYKVYDDGYNPANTILLTRRLVEQDKVFAVVGQLGTEPVQAARPYLNQQKVPQALVATGASYWGTQYKEFPWTIGSSPTTSPRGGCTGSTSRRTIAGRRSRSSTRTTTTARTISTASVRLSESSTPTPTWSRRRPWSSRRPASLAAGEDQGERCADLRHRRDSGADDHQLRDRQGARVQP